MARRRVMGGLSLWAPEAAGEAAKPSEVVQAVRDRIEKQTPSLLRVLILSVLRVQEPVEHKRLLEAIKALDVACLKGIEAEIRRSGENLLAAWEAGRLVAGLTKEGAGLG